jgi:hypothetical protein
MKERKEKKRKNTAAAVPRWFHFGSINTEVETVYVDLVLGWPVGRKLSRVNFRIRNSVSNYDFSTTNLFWTLA